MPDPLIPPEATIRVWTCECGVRWIAYDLGRKQAHDLHGTVRERVYVDLAAVDREAWVERVEAVLKRTYAHSWRREARAVVDDLLGPEDRDA